MLIGLCALFILLISTSRVYLGVHYPTDIIAGIIGGVFCIVLSTLILKTTRCIKKRGWNFKLNIDQTTEMIVSKQ